MVGCRFIVSYNDDDAPRYSNSIQIEICVQCVDRVSDQHLMLLRPFVDILCGNSDGSGGSGAIASNTPNLNGFSSV